MSHILNTQSFHPQPLQVQNLKAKHLYLRAWYGWAQGKPPDHSGQPQHFLMVEFSPLKSHDLQFLISNDRTIRSAVFLPKYFGSLVFCHFVITLVGQIPIDSQILSSFLLTFQNKVISTLVLHYLHGSVKTKYDYSGNISYNSKEMNFVSLNSGKRKAACSLHFTACIWHYWMILRLVDSWYICLNWFC